MAETCLFCRIASGAVPARRVAEGEDWLAFEDINPQAPVHVLVIPKRHVESVEDAAREDPAWLGRLLAAVPAVAAARGLAARPGYRVVTNVGPDAGQSVFHLHLHVLGGRPMRWPPG